MRSLLVGLFCIAFATAAHAGWPPEKITFKQPEGDPLELHVFSPKGNNKAELKPAIVFFFGGGWKNGKVGAFYPQCLYFSDRGMIAITAQYRTQSSHAAFPDTCVMDARSAMRYVRAHARELGIDPNKILAGGGSAGGHVAACTALPGAPDDPSDDLTVSPRPDALVLFNPVLDVGPQGYAHGYVKSNSPNWEAINPMTKVDEKFPPNLVMVGSEDNVLPEATARAFQQSLKDKGVQSELEIYPGAKHGFFNKDPAQSETNKRADAFLTALGYLKNEAPAK